MTYLYPNFVPNPKTNQPLVALTESIPFPRGEAHTVGVHLGEGQDEVHRRAGRIPGVMIKHRIIHDHSWLGVQGKWETQ